MLEGTWNHSSSETGSITIASSGQPITHTPQPMHLSRSTTDAPGTGSGSRPRGGRDDAGQALRALGDGVHRAALDAGAAGRARLGIDDGAVVRLSAGPSDTPASFWPWKIPQQQEQQLHVPMNCGASANMVKP